MRRRRARSCPTAQPSPSPSLPGARRPPSSPLFPYTTLFRSGQQVKSVFLIPDHDGVAGVITAIELHHVIDTSTEGVGRFTFTLIAPLGSNKHYGWHRAKTIGALSRLRLWPDSQNQQGTVHSAAFLLLRQ